MKFKAFLTILRLFYDFIVQSNEYKGEREHEESFHAAKSDSN